MAEYREYGDLHRSVLQTLMSHGTIEENELESVFRILFEKNHRTNLREDNTEEYLKDVIDKINERISRFDQTILKHKYGFNGLSYYVFINTAATSIAKLQHTFTQNELDFFKLIFTNILENDELYIRPRNALNLQSGLKGKLNKMRAETLIDLWISGGYFYRDQDRIYLGPKSITEFKELLQKMELNYLRTCMLCECLCPWSASCALCKTAFHQDCIQTYIARTNKCPSCKEDWETAEMER